MANSAKPSSDRVSFSEWAKHFFVARNLLGYAAILAASFTLLTFFERYANVHFANAIENYRSLSKQEAENAQRRSNSLSSTFTRTSAPSPACRASSMSIVTAQRSAAMPPAQFRKSTTI
jgi:hypothetical protein